jgi:hypothetical protein
MDSRVGASESPVKGGATLIPRLLATIRQLCRALGDRRLKRGHRRLLASVAQHINDRTRTAWPGMKALGAAAELDDETVRVMLQELRRWGYIGWHDGPRPNAPLSCVRHFWLIGCQPADCIADDTGGSSDRIAGDTDSVSRAIRQNKEKKEQVEVRAGARDWWRQP